ncbi:MAG: branched-chain amino acid ABC transporter permease [Acidimicrobiia bacterium]
MVDVATALTPREQGGSGISLTRAAKAAPGTGIVVLLVSLPWLLNAHWLPIATDAVIYAIALLSFVVLYGMLGQISFCQAELMGVSAFTAAALTEHHTVPTGLAVLIAMAITIPVAMIVALPGLRLRGFNLSLATLAFAVALDNYVLSTETVSHFEIGRPAGRPGWDGHPLGDESFFLLVLAVFLVVAFAVSWLRRAGLGRSFRAVRDSEVAARASGLSVWRYKLAGWAISSALAGLAGALLAFQRGTVNFHPFTVTQSLFLFAVAVIGGTSSVVGAGLAAAFFVVVPEALSYVEPTGKYTYLVYGAGTIAVLLLAPRGLTALGGQVRDGSRRLRNRSHVTETS